MHLQNGAIVPVAHEYVDKSRCERVHYSAWIDTELLISITAEILYRCMDSWFLNDDIHRTETKRTRSPGASKHGFSFVDENNSVSVRPMICHPPGDSRE